MRTHDTDHVPDPAHAKLVELVAEAEAAGLSKAQIASDMGDVRPSLLNHWLARRTRPGAAYRVALEKWSCGRLPASLWLDSDPDERGVVDRVKPFRPIPAQAA